jgi:probable HAF family extracellular repeat protein
MKSQNENKTFFGIALATSAIALGLTNPARAASFQGLGDLPGGNFFSRALGVSGDGSTVVGTSNIGGGSLQPNEAFRWTQATGMIGLGNNSIGVQVNSQAFGISQDGSVIVGQLVNFDNNIVRQTAFRWTALEGIVGLPYLPSLATDVSADGSIIVGYGVGLSNNVNATEAFRYTASVGVLGLGDLPGGSFFSIALGVSDDGSRIVGRGSNNINTEAFLWTQANGMIGLGYISGGGLLRAARSQAAGISSNGSVIVGYSTSPRSGVDGFEAFRWTQETGMIGLGFLGTNNITSSAEAVSADGSVIVGTSGQAFIWDSANGMRNLQDVLTTDFGLNLTGWQLSEAKGISADGLTIVGYGTNPSGQNEGWIARLNATSSTSTPEPSSVFAIGLVSLLGLATRYKKR